MKPPLIEKRRILSIQNNVLLAPPQAIRLDIASACNLNCCYCWVHSLLEKQPPQPLFLPFDAIQNIFQTACYWQLKDISLSGDGEPTLHPQFAEIVHLARQNQIALTLTTNATFSPSLIKTVALIPEILINFSAPTKELYHQIQSPQNPNIYDKVMSNLYYLAELSQHRKIPNIHFVCIIHQHNIHCIPDLLQIAKKFHAKRISFRMIDPTQNTQCLYPSIPDQKNIIRIIEKILKKPIDIPHNLKDIQEELLSPQSSPYHLTSCYVGWFMLFVNLNLDVGFCCHNESILFDNLKNKTLKEIWESPKAHQIRLLCKNHFDIKRHPFKGECEWCYWYQDNQRIHQNVHSSNFL